MTALGSAVIVEPYAALGYRVTAVDFT